MNVHTLAYFRTAGAGPAGYRRPGDAELAERGNGSTLAQSMSHQSNTHTHTNSETEETQETGDHIL